MPKALDIRTYLVSAAEELVRKSRLRFSKAKHWLLGSMEAIWIVHCDCESLDSVLSESLTDIVY